MSNLRKVMMGTVAIQAILLAILGLIFWVALPHQGIAQFSDLDNAEKVNTVSATLYMVNWIHVFFSISLLLTSIGLYSQVRKRIPTLIRFILAIVLATSVTFFVVHDLGFGIHLWHEILADPAATVFSQDNALMNVRNVLFFIVGILTVLDGNGSRIRKEPS